MGMMEKKGRRLFIVPVLSNWLDRSMCMLSHSVVYDYYAMDSSPPDSTVHGFSRQEY